MSTGVILTRGAGKKFPPDISKFLMSTTGTWGYSIFADGKLMIADNLSPKDLVDPYGAVLDEFNTVLYFGEDKAQPFIAVKDEKDVPQLVCFIEGDYADHHDTNGLSDEQNFFNTVLQPEIDEILELVEGDVTKLVKALKKDKKAGDIMARYGERGTVTFMDNTGDFFALEKPGKHLDFDWGTASQGISVLSGEVASPIAKTELTTAEKLALMRAKKSPDGVHTTEATAAKLTGSDTERTRSPLLEDVKNAAALASSTAIPKVSQDLVYPPEEAFVSKSKLKDWYNLANGTCPQGYGNAMDEPDKAIGIPRIKLKDGVAYSLSPGGKTVVSSDGTGKPAASGAGKDAVKTGATTVVVGAFPIIPAHQKEIQGHFLKAIDLKSTDIMDPAKQADIEKKASGWFDQHGYSMEDFMRIPPIKIREMVVKWPNDGQLLIETLRYMIAVNLLSHKKTDKEAPSTKAVDSQSVADKLAAMRTKKTA